MSMWVQIIFRKRCITEYINDLPKNKADIVCSWHCSMRNVSMNICTALTADTSFENKPEGLPVHVEKTVQLTFLGGLIILTSCKDKATCSEWFCCTSIQGNDFVILHVFMLYFILASYHMYCL